MLNPTPLVLFGGAFNPPHKGHLDPIEQLGCDLDFSEIRLLPSPSPPHKRISAVGLEQRIEMTKLACSEYERLRVDETESHLPSPTYTVQTLRYFRERFPQRSIVFVMGMDSLVSLDRWIEWQDMTELCHLVVLPRPGFKLTDNQRIHNWAKPQLCRSWQEIHSLPHGRICLAETPLWPISSTQIRTELAGRTNNSKLTQWLALPVINYIKQHNLYVTQDEEKS